MTKCNFIKSEIFVGGEQNLLPELMFDFVCQNLKTFNCVRGNQYELEGAIEFFATNGSVV